MSDSGYLQALETRLAWLRWLNTPQVYAKLARLGRNQTNEQIRMTLAACQMVLEHSGGTYYMTAPFCSMVDQLRVTMPDSLELEPQWMLSEGGFVLFANRFEDLITDAMVKEAAVRGEFLSQHIDAIGWSTLENGRPIFIGFADAARFGIEGFSFGFLPVSVYGIPFHTSIQTCLEMRNSKLFGGSRPVDVNVTASKKDCTHLTYTMLYMMAQKLATTKAMESNRAQRRRLEQEQVPFDSVVKVVTLRRLEQQSKDNHESHPVDWQCQWLVRWHWRNQYCPSTGEHKWVAVDTYVKGPADKPLKQPSARIFVASR